MISSETQFLISNKPQFLKAWTSQSYANDTALRRFKINETVGHGLGIAVESMGILSYQRAYRQVISSGNRTSTSVTYPLMMAVIHVTKGKVTVSIYHDNCSTNVLHILFCFNLSDYSLSFFLIIAPKEHKLGWQFVCVVHFKTFSVWTECLRLQRSATGISWISMLDARHSVRSSLCEEQQQHCHLIVRVNGKRQ